MDTTTFPFCSEVYIVEKTIEVVVDLKGDDDSTRIRIDALHSLNNPNMLYSTKSYVEEMITAQPSYPKIDGKYAREAKPMRIWKDYDLPWTSGRSADEVLRQTLSFLGERCNR